MHDFSDEELISACRVLFGPDVALSRDFLWYLQLEGAKSAFRRRARETHPDAHQHADVGVQLALSEEFGRAAEAYKLLCSFLHYREQLKTEPGYRQWSRLGRANDPGYSSDRKASGEGELFFRGVVPEIEIRTGRYLYFRGVTSFQSIIRALTWQRKQRPLIGALARQWGWLDEQLVRTILTSRHLSGRFGERALELGVLNDQQHKALLTYQRSCQQRLGNYFVKNGIVSGQEMETLARERLMHNIRVRNNRRKRS